jgi:hypothetical protein
VQAITLFQAALRGADYAWVSTAPAPALARVEQAASLTVWGWLFYGSAVLVLVGIAARHVVPVVLGHLLLFAWYAGIGLPVLAAQSGMEGHGWVGLPLGVLGAGVVITRHVRSDLVRLLVGVPFMLAAHYLLADSLGTDYRTGTGLVGGGLVHLTLAVATAVAAGRQILSAEVERERLPLLDTRE